MKRVIVEGRTTTTEEFRPSDGFMAAQWVVVKITKSKKKTDRMSWYRKPQQQ